MDSQRTDRLEDRYYDIHEAAEILEVNEEELWDLVHKHRVPTHTIAGAFLRFKKEDIEDLKNKWRIERELFPQRSGFFIPQGAATISSLTEKVRDFWYFNDFYMLCAVLIAVLLYSVISSQ